MKIVNKLVLSLSVVIFLVIVQGVAGGVSFIWIKRSADELEKASYHASLINNLNVTIHQWVVSAEFVIKGESLQDYFHLNTILLEECISSIAGEPLPVGVKEILDTIIINFNGLKDYMKELRSEEKTKGIKDVENSIHKLLSEVENLASKHRSYVDMVKARANMTRNIGVYMSIAIPVACVIIIVFMGLSIGRGIVHSIRYLVSVTEVMGKGDLTNAVDLKTKDEFGILARAFENMRFGLKIYHDCINELNKILKQRIEERKQAEEKLIDYQKQLKSLASELSLTEERERRSIASDLHDSISQGLVVTKMKLSELRAMKISDVVDCLLNDICKILDKMIQDTRTLTFELSPPVLYELGFGPAVEWLIEQIQEQHGIKIDIIDDGRPKPLNEDIRILLFKAVRELLINVVKHAGAQITKVLIKRDGNNILIEVEDNGIGFDTSRFHFSVSGEGGFGLFNIRERLEHLGGCFEIKSEVGRGTRISLVAPLKCEDEIVKGEII